MRLFATFKGMPSMFNLIENSAYKPQKTLSSDPLSPPSLYIPLPLKHASLIGIVNFNSINKITLEKYFENLSGGDHDRDF